MADAGFYFIGTAREPDLVRCYWCRKELDGWEPTDDPMEEHRRRDQCPFIKLGKPCSKLTVEDMLKLETARGHCLTVKLMEKRKEPLKDMTDQVRQINSWLNRSAHAAIFPGPPTHRRHWQQEAQGQGQEEEVKIGPLPTPKTSRTPQPSRSQLDYFFPLEIESHVHKKKPIDDDSSDCSCFFSVAMARMCIVQAYPA